MEKINKKELHSIFTELRNENKEVYNILYEKYYKLVYGVAFSILKNKEDSEDITNDVFTKIYKMEKEKLPVSNEASWLYIVTKNECFMHLRKTKANISIDEIYDIPSDSKEMQEIVDIEYYNKLISKLSEQEKTIVSLKVLSNFTFDKIAKIMGIPIGTVQWKYYKAINSLKISISSLTGAIIAFILILAGKDKFSMPSELNPKNEKKRNSEYSTDSSKELENEINMHNDSIIDQKEGITTNTIQESEINVNSNLYIYNTVCITAGIVLFITFIIFFKKYQQKLRKKTSK